MKKFFQKTHFVFEITPKLESFKKTYYFSRITRPICYFYLFLKVSFFSKNLSPFWEKKWTFREILNFQSHSMTILPSLAIFKFSCFLWKDSFNFLYKNQILNVSRTFTISVAFYSKLATFTDFEIIHFFEKSIFFRKKWAFWEIVIFAEKSHSTTILLSLAMLKNSCFFWKTSSSFSIKAILERFQNFYYFCRILRQIC